jgi:hypothetical protein
MKSFRSIAKLLEKELHSAWNSLGLSFSSPPVRESKLGLIDPEATILLTVLFSKHNRIMTDVPAWISRFSDLINHGKIKSLLSVLTTEQKEAAIDTMRDSHFEACPIAFKRAVGLAGKPPEVTSRELRSRGSKIRPIEAVSGSCAMIRNRLLFGTGFRADIVSVIQAVPFPLRVNQVASLTGSAESTASRIIFDLKAFGFLDKHNQVSEDKGTGQGLFVSTDSLRNASILLESRKFESKELRQDALDNMELRFDGLMRKVGV